MVFLSTHAVTAYNTGQTTLLDLVLCNCPDVIDEINVRSSEECSFPTDHFIIDFNINLDFRRIKPVKRTVYDFRNADFDGLNDALSSMVFDVNNTSDIDKLWSSWKDSFLTAVKDHIPTRTIKDTNFPPWVDNEVRQKSQEIFSVEKVTSKQK